MTQPFQFANGQLAYSAEDLLKLCQEFPADGVNYLVREDLEKWLTYIGKEDIAQCAANARQTPLEDRQKLEEFLTKCHALSSAKTENLSKTHPSESTPEVTETTLKENPIESDSIETNNTIETAPPEKASVATKSSSLPQSKTSESSSTQAKPSFFRTIAKLIVNVLYRN